MKAELYSLNETAALIKSGAALLIAADEALLKQLPAGNWIAGTTPYFVGNNGGVQTNTSLFVNQLTSEVGTIKICEYTAATIDQIYTNTPANGFTVVIIPASSETHTSFALNAPQYPDFASRPVVGWIAGMQLSDIGKISAKVITGTNTQLTDTNAVAMHVTLPSNAYAELFIVNIFKQGEGDIISFIEDGFAVTDAYVNGKRVNFAQYVTEKNIDTRLPLVADYLGAEVNISFQAVNLEQKNVQFYAPVFKGVQYKLAAPLQNYAQEFEKQIKTIDNGAIAFSCNCILNYVYGELEGKKTSNITGPITFGEIAYQLLNQTLTYLTINKS